MSPGKLKKLYGGTRRLIIGRTANLTQPLPGRGQCQTRDACWLGCPFGAYFSTQSSTLPAAMATGNLTLKPYSIVTRCCTTRTPRRRAACAWSTPQQRDHRVQGEGHLPLRLHAEQHLAAHALGHRPLAGWPRQQQRRARAQPHGPPLPPRRERNSSRGSTTSTTTAVAPPASTSRATRTSSATSAPTCVASATRGAPAAKGWGRAVAELGIGGDFKDAMAQPGQWTIGATAFGEMLPDHDNKITIDETKKDKWGLPVLKIDCEIGENETLMRKDMTADMAEMLEARREGRAHLRRRLLPRHGHPRDGHGAHGPRSRRRRCSTATTRCGTRRTSSSPTALHDLGGVREPVAHLHGAHGARGRFAVASRSALTTVAPTM
jgi:hypothetical protein